MRPNVVPSFEMLEKLARGRDAELATRRLVNPARNRGRGAQTNHAGRYERQQREALDESWAGDDISSSLETVEHTERAQSIITRVDSPDIGFDRSVNPYRGCEHGCSYCFARQTHAYLGHSAGLDFERNIYVKVNAAEQLRRELANPRYKAKPLAIGTNTDPYQPIERKRRVMRDVLEVVAEAKHPVSIITKSALVARDLDILTEMAKHNLVEVAISVTSMDHRLSRAMEPRASSPARRLEALKLLSEAGIPTRVLASPMIPALNDHELDRILDAARAQGARAASMVLLRLPGEVRDVFREWLLRYYPERLQRVMSLVRDTRGGKDYDASWGKRMTGEGPYALMLQQRFQHAMARFGLSEHLPPLRCDLFKAPAQEQRQLDLF